MMTKTCFLFFLFLLFYVRPAAQSVAIGTAAPDSSALLHLHSTSKGILIPGMTAGQRLAIDKPARGLLVYQHDEPQGFYFFNGTAWTELGAVQKGLADTAAVLRAVLQQAISDSLKYYSWTTFYADSDYWGAGTEADPLRVKNKLDSALGLSLLAAKAPVSSPQFSGLATLNSDTLATLKDVRTLAPMGKSTADTLQMANTPPLTGNFYFDTGRGKLGVRFGSQWLYFSPTDSVPVHYPATRTSARTVRINFTNQFSNVSSAGLAKWNHLQPTAASLTSSPPTFVSNFLVDENNVATNWTLAPSTAWDGAAVGTNSSVPTEGSGLYANAIITSAWLTRGTASLVLTGLTPGTSYEVYLLTQGTGTSVTATYSLNGVTKSINAQGAYGTPPVPPSTEYQSTAWVVFDEVTPSANGELTVQLSRSGQYYQVGIAAMIIREQNNP